MKKAAACKNLQREKPMKETEYVEMQTKQNENYYGKVEEMSSESANALEI